MNKERELLKKLLKSEYLEIRNDETIRTKSEFVDGGYEFTREITNETFYLTKYAKQDTLKLTKEEFELWMEIIE